MLSVTNVPLVHEEPSRPDLLELIDGGLVGSAAAAIDEGAGHAGFLKGVRNHRTYYLYCTTSEKANFRTPFSVVSETRPFRTASEEHENSRSRLTAS